MFKIEISPFFKNILSTTVASFCVTASLILTTRILATGLGPDEFGVYSLARRFIANMSPLILLSMGVSLRRYVAMSFTENDHRTYIMAAVVSVSVLIFLLLSFSWLGGRSITRLVFSDKAYINTFYASVIFMGCYCYWVITSASLFGMQKVRTVNFYQLLIGGALPLVVASIFADSQSSSKILMYIGLGNLICLVVLVPELFKGLKSTMNIKKELVHSFSVLSKYGLPRVPGDFLFAGLFSLGPFLASYFGSVKQAGFFVIAQYIFRVMEAAISAFGQVAIPKIAQLVVQNKTEFLKHQIENLVVMVFHMGLFTTIHLSIWADEIVLSWLGNEYRPSIAIIQVIIISLGPYLAYVLLRSVIDAVEVRAVNTMNLFISLTSAVVSSFVFHCFGFQVIGLAAGSAIGYSVLGILTILFLARRFKIRRSNFLFWPSLVINISLALVSFFVKFFLAGSQSFLYSILGGLLVEGVILGAYLITLYNMNTGWLLEIRKRVVR
nr:lipopolysaccharide biosynthesis protein [uncultured Desulfobacter sp.]